MTAAKVAGACNSTYLYWNVWRLIQTSWNPETWSLELDED